MTGMGDTSGAGSVAAGEVPGDWVGIMVAAGVAAWTGLAVTSADGSAAAGDRTVPTGVCWAGDWIPPAWGSEAGWRLAVQPARENIIAVQKKIRGFPFISTLSYVRSNECRPVLTAYRRIIIHF